MVIIIKVIIEDVGGEIRVLMGPQIDLFQPNYINVISCPTGGGIRR